MWLLGHVNRRIVLPRRFLIQDIDVPAADRERLRAAVSSSTAAFLAPNHPEFGLDWMLDKEISTICAPMMAAWAAHEIIAAAPWFWTRNNLVSNRGGRAALDHSVVWALRGGGVLLHPEGTVRWTSDVVHPLFTGVAEMAIEAARRAGERPVFIVPLVWKVHYTRDVSAGIHAEITYIERTLELRETRGTPLVERFASLNEQILARQARRFGIQLPGDDDFFVRQASLRARLVAELLSRHTVEPTDSIERVIHRLGKIVSSRDDRARVREAERLGGFTREWYGGPMLTPEHLHECLKRIRADLVHGGFRDAMHNALPKPYGPRIVRVRVPDAIRIRGDESVPLLLGTLRTSMQRMFDEINREIAPVVGAFAHPNPFASSQTTLTRSHSGSQTINWPDVQPIAGRTTGTSVSRS